MEKQNETVTISKAEYEKLLQTAAETENLQSQIDWLTERVRLLTKKQFGASSEKIIDDELMNQVGMLFNETEYIADIAAKAEKTTVKEYTRRHSGSVDDVIPEGTPTEIIEHRLSEEERTCPECGTVMDEIGYDIRRILIIVPAQVKVREEYFYTYACRKCEKENDHTPMKLARIHAVIPGSFVSP